MIDFARNPVRRHGQPSEAVQRQTTRADWLEDYFPDLCAANDNWPWQRKYLEALPSKGVTVSITLSTKSLVEATRRATLAMRKFSDLADLYFPESDEDE